MTMTQAVEMVARLIKKDKGPNSDTEEQAQNTQNKKERWLKLKFKKVMEYKTSANFQTKTPFWSNKQILQ